MSVIHWFVSICRIYFDCVYFTALCVSLIKAPIVKWLGFVLSTEVRHEG